MSTQSTTPPPKKTLRSRVGTVMRRSSTSWSLPGLPNRSTSTPPPSDSDSVSIAGSTTSKLEREGSASSIKQFDTVPFSNQMTTTTIPESPAREAAALASETAPQGPSPLSGQVVTVDPTSQPSLQPPEEERKPVEAVEPESSLLIPSVVVNPPESAAETVLTPVLTAEPEEMSISPTVERARTQATPPPESTQAPITSSTLAPATNASARVSTPPATARTPPPETSTPARAPRPVGEAAPASTPALAPSAALSPHMPPSTPPLTPPTMSRRPSSAPPTPPAEMIRAPSSAPPTPPADASGYFDLALQRTASPLDADADEVSNVWADHLSTSAQPTTPPPGPAPAPVIASPISDRHAVPKTAKTTTRARGSSVSSSQLMGQRQPSQPSRKPSSIFQPREREIVGTTYTWSDSSSVLNQSKGSLSLPAEDSLADSRVPAAGYQLNSAEQPADMVSPVVPSVIDPRSPRDDSMIATAEPVAVPLPAMHEVMLTHSVRQVPSSEYTSSDGESAGYFGRDILRDTNERRPLITRQSHPSTPRITTTFPFQQPSPSSQIARSYRSQNPNLNVSQPTPQRPQPARLEANGSAHTYSYGSVSRPYADRGWIEKALPHGAKYFVNPRIHATTDVDLRNLAKLDAVMLVVETAGIAPEGCEMWARESPAVKSWRRQKKAGGPVISWIDHRVRRVSSDVPSVDGIILSGEDDRMDDEYRYWSFVESHPAHISLPTSALQEAVDALHWSYTDPLLAHSRPISPPFSQDECLKLLGHLNDPNLRSTTTHTRMIARILLRIAHWRQMYFRPHKQLPRDVPIMQPPKQHVPIGRMVVSSVVGLLCLGIPFLLDRTSYVGQLDMESGVMSGSGSPMFLTGACACLVAAVILSASVTLMTLPGLNGIARIAGLVAIMCSVLSMITSFVSIIRYKTEMVHGTPTSGSEGFVFLSRRSVLLSLPLVFLAYSVAGFITGVVIYSFNDAIGDVTASVTMTSRFDDWSRLLTVGVLGGVVGVFVTCAVVQRR